MVTDNYFQGKMYGNQIGNNFEQNIIGYEFANNIINANCQANTFGTWFQDNIVGFNFGNNTVGHNVYNNIFGAYVLSNIIENGIAYIIIPDKGFGTEFNFNIIKNGVKGLSVTPLDFTSATHVFLDYNCEIFTASDGSIKLSYIKEDTGVYTLEIVDYDA